ncbi:unnamed protein product [Linum trigynum]|uniref:Uncharacterized protein n=1 Tax=Linum trigynum TaxID=586398 RepID=A0AAV2CR85_9ROSI
MSRLHHLSIRNPPVFDSSYRCLTDVIASICTHRHHESLRTLNMDGVDVALVPMTAASGFQMLTTLQLRSCEFHDPDPFGGFPCLNHLKLFNCTSSPSGFVVLGPHLVDQEIDSPFLSDGLIRDLPALDHATIHLHWHEYLLVAPSFRSYVSREGSICARLNLFGDLHNAESLILCFDSSTEITDQNSPLTEWKSPLMERAASPFTRLKALRMQFKKPSPTLSVPEEVIRYFFGDSFDPLNKSAIIENMDNLFIH